MSDLGEIGESLGEVFGSQAEALAATVQDATDQLQAMQTQFEETVGPEAGPGLEQLHARLELVAMTLGSLASDVGELQVAGRGYLARIGFAADNDFAPACPPAVSRAAPERKPPLDPQVIAKLSTGLESLLSDSADPAMRRCVNSAVRSGIRSVHDVHLMGVSGLKDLPNLGPKGVGNLNALVSEFCPELSLPDGPDPTVAAQICDSLGEVPISVLKGHQDLFRKIDRVTVEDLLTRPAEELFKGRMAVREPWLHDDSLSLWETDRIENLRQRARDYAAGFKAAKTR